MRWIWIDKIIELVSGQSAVTIKNVSLAEEHLHDLYPAFPVVPHSLIVEGFAQTAGILVCEARQFAEKVVLAKISHATFHQLVRPGDCIEFRATIDQLSEHGASTSGQVVLRHPAGEQLIAQISMMFSHIDRNMAGLSFPEHNFVFTEQFEQLLRTYQRDDEIKI
ncbi:MAG: beta-hydroxyacyl-ACP dehydratase [Phycisphaerales bacterium]|nr:beta-hydroxyacyl-ACP dehydratase [Phycisphaerales bacterium]